MLNLKIVLFPLSATYKILPFISTSVMFLNDNVLYIWLVQDVVVVATPVVALSLLPVKIVIDVVVGIITA